LKSVLREAGGLAWNAELGFAWIVESSGSVANGEDRSR
jgi:hypothetical protein